MPPVSKRTPGGRRTSPPAVVDLEARASARPGRGRAGRRGGASASASASGGRRDSRARPRVAGGLDLADQGRIDQAAARLGGLDAGADGVAQQRRRRDPLARVGVQRAELAVGSEARQAGLEPLDELASPPRPPRAGRASPGPGLADQRARRAHRAEGDVGLLMMSRWRPARQARARGQARERSGGGDRRRGRELDAAPAVAEAVAAGGARDRRSPGCSPSAAG